MKHSYKIHPIESSQIKEFLSDECLEFVMELHMLFNSQRLHLLSERNKIQQKLDSGWTPDFLYEILVGCQIFLKKRGL